MTTSSRQPFAYCQDRILAEIVYPDVRKAAQTTDNPSIAAIHKTFRDLTNSTVSKATFREWLRGAGVSIENRVTIQDNPPATSLGEEADHDDA